MKIYSKHLASCVHFCAANRQAQNFCANNETVFLTFFSKKFDQIPLRLLWCIINVHLQPVSFFFQMCQQKGQVQPSAPNLKVFCYLGQNKMCLAGEDCIIYIRVYTYVAGQNEIQV